jgi:twitching motility protein PilT
MPATSTSPSGNRPCFVCTVGCVKLETKTSKPDDTVALMKSITPERCQQELQEQGSTDFGFAFGDKARFRVSVFKQRGNTAMVLAADPQRSADAWSNWARPRLCGNWSCDRVDCAGHRADRFRQETTLASMIDYINENVDHHIITIEDPIEFYHYHKKSTVNQREVGVDVPSFAEAIRRALRQDPDVILVGEMRDLETIEAAITRRKPATSCSARCTPRGPRARSTVSSTCSPQTSRIRFAPSCPRRSSASVAGAAAQDRRRPCVPPTKCWWSRRASPT